MLKFLSGINLESAKALDQLHLTALKKETYFSNENYCLEYFSYLIAHQTTNFTNPELLFPQFKVLQSVFIFCVKSYIGIF